MNVFRAFCVWLTVLYSLFIVSCNGMDLNSLVDESNEQVGNSTEDGSLITINGKDYFYGELLELTELSVPVGYAIPVIKCLEGYEAYKWWVTDNSSGQEKTGFLDTMSFLYIHSKDCNMTVGEYTVKVTTTSRVGNTFTDTMKLLITEKGQLSSESVSYNKSDIMTSSTTEVADR